MKNNIIKKIEKISCGEVIINSSLKKYNTYKVDSNVLALVLTRNIDELKKIIKFCKDENMDYKIIGNGSNLIYCKKYYEKIFINLCNLNKFSIDDNIVIAESGVSLQKLALKVSKIGLSGLEFATGIPATIGGAIYMNAGAYNDGTANGEDIKNLILYTKKEVKNKYNIDLKIEQEFVE